MCVPIFRLSAVCGYVKLKGYGSGVYGVWNVCVQRVCVPRSKTWSLDFCLAASQKCQFVAGHSPGGVAATEVAVAETRSVAGRCPALQSSVAGS